MLRRWLVAAGMVLAPAAAAALIAWVFVNGAARHEDDAIRLTPETALAWAFCAAAVIWLGCHRFRAAPPYHEARPARTGTWLRDERAQTLEASLLAAAKGSPTARVHIEQVVAQAARQRSLRSGAALSPQLEDLCRRVEAGRSPRRVSRRRLDGYLKEIASL